MSTRIDLHLRIRIRPGRREAFLAFLREAIPFYESGGGHEQPGAIQVRLLEDPADDHRFIELVLYTDQAAFDRDQERVKNDPEMARWLARWRELLAEPPVVEVYRLRSPV